MNQTLLIDFDSTIVGMESLDLLAAISLSGNPEADNKVASIKDITNAGMNGDITFEDSLRMRLAIFTPQRIAVVQTAQYLERHISPSFRAYQEEIARQADSIYIISGGFKEIIVPIVKPFGIDPSHVYANEFRFDATGNYLGIDEANLLAQKDGKAKIARRLQDEGRLIHPVIAIGDGGTDLQFRQAGIADYFFAFTETARRQPVLERMQNTTNCFEAKSFQEVADFLGWQRPRITEGQQNHLMEMAYTTPMQWRK